MARHKTPIGAGNNSNPNAPHPTAGKKLRYHSANKRARREAREEFLVALRVGHTISKAAELADISLATISAWRKSDPEFAAEWTEAYETGTDKFEEEATRRAIDGVPGRPIVVYGMDGKDAPPRIIETVEYSDTLLVTMLKARRPEKFRERVTTEMTGPGGGPLRSVNANIELTTDQFIEIAKKITSEI